MRSARIKLEETATYHCMSRVIERRMRLGDLEKEHFRDLMRKIEFFCGVQVLDYTILTNHFHILLRVPVRQIVSDKELIRRIRRLYGTEYAREVGRRLARLREAGEAERAEALRAQYTNRMYDVSEYMKTLKQRFTQWYNRGHGRKGTLWEERFKSVLVEGRSLALRTMAAYIDLNPVRAGIVEDPRTYRYCGYAEAMAGDRRAREGLGMVMRDVVPDGDWRRVSRAYRRTMFERGITGKGKRIDAEKVREQLAHGGELSGAEALRCKVRYFSDGVVLGSREFVDAVFRSHREQFGPRRKTGARAMRYGAWGGLCTMRDLRQTVISVEG